MDVAKFNSNEGGVWPAGDPKERARLLDALSKDNAPEGYPVSGREMNELQEAHDTFMDSLNKVKGRTVLRIDQLTIQGSWCILEQHYRGETM